MMRLFIYLLVILALVMIIFWRQIVRLILNVLSQLSRSHAVSLENDRIVIHSALVLEKLDGLLKIECDLPHLVRTGFLSFCVKIDRLSVGLSIVKFKRKLTNSSQPQIRNRRWISLISYLPLPSVQVEEIQFETVFASPDAGVVSWSSVVLMNGFGVHRDRRGGICLGLEKLSGNISMSNRLGSPLEYVAVTSVRLSVADSQISAVVSSITGSVDLEMYFEIIKTLENFIYLDPGAAVSPSSSIQALPTEVSFSVETFALQFQAAAVGNAILRVEKIFGEILKNSNFSIKASSCVISRNSNAPDVPAETMVRLPPFTVSGIPSLVDINIPQAQFRTCSDGLVYWIRALVLCGSRFSVCKRPYRMDVRNERTALYYAYEMCGLEPPDWSAVPSYTPSVVGVRIRVNFLNSVELRTDKEERVITEDAIIDVDLKMQTVTFSANAIEIFGISRSRSAFVKNFSGHVSLFSACCLRDSQLPVPADVQTLYVRPSLMGPVPVAIRLADVRVELAEELIFLIGDQLMQALDNMRKWDIELGYAVVPLYKPVTIRLSRVRFAPLELAPAVLDVKNFEVAIGPTKDCLGFAFEGVKAWVPCTVTIPPILHMQEAGIVSLRVKRAAPLVRVEVASDYASQPGCWRTLQLRIPQIEAAVAPGLHATTRLIDTIMKTVRGTVRGKFLNKGPIKTVSVVFEGGKIDMVKNFVSAHLRARTTDDIDSSAQSDLLIASVHVGRLEMEMGNFLKNVKVDLASLDLDIPRIASCSVSRVTAACVDGERYAVVISEESAIDIGVKNNAMAIFAAFSALKDCFQKAWFIDPRPKLNQVVSHIIDTNASIKLVVEEASGDPGRLVSAKVSFAFPQGVQVSWSVPHSAGVLTVSIPAGNKLEAETVFHGFALTTGGDENFRKLPQLTDQVLIQWLRYPWTVGGGSEQDTSSVHAERESWDLHSVMTMRISDYLASAGPTGCWEYGSGRGLVNTPMYMQILVSLREAEVCLVGRRIGGIENFEMRAHCHNLPTTKAPKIKMSYWTSWTQDASKGLCLDIVPQVHFPLLLTLIGSPADTDPTSAAASASSESESIASFPSSYSLGGTTFLDKALSQIDLGFRITIVGLTGRAGGWSFASSRVTLFKEEDKGKGLIVVDIRSAQIALETALSLNEAVQPLHSRVCLSVPIWMPALPTEVFPFLSVRQMMIHIGLHSPLPVSSQEPTVVFCNIQGARLWWSPSLSRGMRESLTRSDKMVEMLSRWKARFSRELAARIGKNYRKKKTFDTIMKLLDLFIPVGGSVKLLLRCADVQLNFHTLLNGVDDLFSSSCSETPPRTPPDIPKHFVAFRSGGTPKSEPSTPVSPLLTNTQVEFSRCECTFGVSSESEDFSNLKKFFKSDYINLESPRILSWWTKAAHMQHCPLPPLPLPEFNAPPNSKRERAIGALKWNVWVDQCHAASPLVVSPPITSPMTQASAIGVKPKPRGSQMLLNAAESVFEVTLTRTKGPSNLNVCFNAALNTLQGSVAPTALRGLVWLGQSGQSILRQILQINRINFILTADLFPLKSAKVRVLIPNVILSTDDDAFHILIDVFRNAILYRGAVINPNTSNFFAPQSASPVTPQKHSVRFDGPVPAGKRESIIEALLTSLAVSDATLAPSTDHLSLEYIIESIGINLTHRQRCFVQLQLSMVVGKHSFSLNHPHRPMQFSFQVGDVSIVSADPSGETGNDRNVVRSAGSSSGANIITIRGNDRYITLNNREWQVYDTLFLSISPVVVDVTQDLIEELYAFIFPPISASAPEGGGSLYLLAAVEEHVEVAGNRLLTGRNKSKVVVATKSSAVFSRQSSSNLNSSINRISSDLGPNSGSVPKKDPAHPSTVNTPHAGGSLIFFKFVRFGNIDSIITFKGKQFSLNHLSLTLKYYLRRRRLATWKEFLDEWGAKVGKQAFGSFVKHGFTRKRGIQDIIVNKFSNLASNDVDKLLFGKYSSH